MSPGGRVGRDFKAVVRSVDMIDPSGSMNKSEYAYAVRLEAMKRSGIIRDWKYEALRLVLADRTSYTPDFLVITGDCLLELHEIKGFWEEDARAKYKIARNQFPYFTFRAFRVKTAKRDHLFTEETF